MSDRQSTLCPPWCVTDHGAYTFHGSEEVTVEAPRYHRVHVRAICYSAAAAGAQEVQVAGGGVVRLPAAAAAELATLVTELATATPDQHRELAAAIRAAAALITGEGAGREPGRGDGSDDH